MSIDIASQLKFWASVDNTQHWRIGSKGIEVISNQADDSNYLTRLYHHVSSFVRGENSLALAISQMSAALKQLNEKECQSLDFDLLKALAAKINAKTAQYDQKHWRVYKLFMWAIGRDLYTVTVELNKQTLVITNAAQRAIDAEALRKSRIPIDRSSDLAPLLKDHRFTLFTDSKKMGVISIYIHMLPLVRKLEANLSDLVDVVSTITYSLNTGQNDGYTVAAIELIRRKKGWTLKENLREMIHLARECGLTCYSYHGTNLLALGNILTNGLGSTTREYDPKIISDANVSGSDTTSFYVAARPDYSYSYGTRSPEWAYFALNSTASQKEQEEARKYQAFTEIALIQIRRAPEKELSEKAIDERIKCISEHGLSSMTVFEWSVATNEINERVQGSTFRPLEAVYYRLPKLKAD